MTHLEVQSVERSLSNCLVPLDIRLNEFLSLHRGHVDQSRKSAQTRFCTQ